MGDALVRDEDGSPLRNGDHITFTFGIPPISVLARISTTGGDLWIECLHPPGVKPKCERLASLMKHYQVWKAHPARVAAYLMDFTITPESQVDPQSTPDADTAAIRHHERFGPLDEKGNPLDPRRRG